MVEDFLVTLTAVRESMRYPSIVLPLTQGTQMRQKKCSQSQSKNTSLHNTARGA